jgi:hypothetical protein
MLESELDRAWEYHKQANGLLAARFSYSMVAHAMLLAAYATLMAANQATPVITGITVAMGVFGVFFSYVQWQITSGLASKVRTLADEYLEKDPVYRRYREVGKRSRGLQTTVVPSILAILWVVLTAAPVVVCLKGAP